MGAGVDVVRLHCRYDVCRMVIHIKDFHSAATKYIFFLQILRDKVLVPYFTCLPALNFLSRVTYL